MCLLTKTYPQGFTVQYRIKTGGSLHEAFPHYQGWRSNSLFRLVFGVAGNLGDYFAGTGVIRVGIFCVFDSTNCPLIKGSNIFG
jgi:hypothetical protein